MRDEHDRAAALLELRDPTEALALELLVADGEDLVEEQHVGVDVRGDREAEPHVHPRRVGANRQVDVVADAGELDDLVHPLADLGAGQAVQRAVQEDVLAAGELRVEPGAELEQRRDAPADLDAADAGLDDPADQLQERRLAGAVSPDQTRPPRPARRASATPESAQTSSPRPRPRVTMSSLSVRASFG